MTCSLLITSFVSETKKQHAFPFLAQRHILAGLASAVGSLTAPYEKASRIHERPVVNWLWATGCHPFGPFSNSSRVSVMLQDVALVSAVRCLKLFLVELVQAAILYQLQAYDYIRQIYKSIIFSFHL